jgi:hypothetical protein
MNNRSNGGVGGPPSLFGRGLFDDPFFQDPFQHVESMMRSMFAPLEAARPRQVGGSSALGDLSGCQKHKTALSSCGAVSEGC